MGRVGQLIQGDVCNSILSFEEDTEKLGRWTLTTMRGPEGRIIRIVGLYVPCNGSGNMFSVKAQHKNYLNAKGLDSYDVVDFFWETFREELKMDRKR